MIPATSPAIAWVIIAAVVAIVLVAPMLGTFAP